jgi:hypothetical protein
MHLVVCLWLLGWFNSLHSTLSRNIAAKTIETNTQSDTIVMSSVFVFFSEHQSCHSNTPCESTASLAINDQAVSLLLSTF